MDWIDLLAVQGTLKSLLQHHFMSYPVLFPKRKSLPIVSEIYARYYYLVYIFHLNHIGNV